MNNLLEDFMYRSGATNRGELYCGDTWFDLTRFNPETFAELIIREHVALLQDEWYDLNNREVPMDETPRELGIRLGRKSQIVILQQKIKEHFGISNE